MTRAGAVAESDIPDRPTAPLRVLLVAALLAMLGACTLMQGSAEKVLARGAERDGWILRASVNGDQLMLEVSHMGGGSGMGIDGAGEVNEAHAETVVDNGQTVTLIYGAVTRQARHVSVQATDDTTAEATLVDIRGWRVFWVRIPGEVRIRDIVATDGGGDVVDRWTLGDMPPPPDPSMFPLPGRTPPQPDATPS